MATDNLFMHGDKPIRSEGADNGCLDNTLEPLLAMG